MERPNAWNAYQQDDLTAVESFARDYRNWLDGGKTERECVTETVGMARMAGYISLEDKIASGTPLCTGDRIYVNQMGKAIMLFRIGRRPLKEGLRIVGAHIDSPRLDLKQNPIYEKDGYAYGDTHYYGGIKKYQWTARELAIHGVINRKDGTQATFAIGENPEDPVVGITDLLVHLSADQQSKKLGEAIDGENLDITLCGRPMKDEEKEPVKATLLKLLKDADLEEEDFLSAEIEFVPAGKSRDFGLDRSMIMAYGHDDRVCAYASLAAILDLREDPEYTACCLLVDKEEIGSVGATGMRARYFENAVAELINLEGSYNDLILRRALAASAMLSCDVSAGYDPLYASAFEKKNAAQLGCGVCYNKFTGSRGKSGSNDANAEYLATVRKLMDDHKIAWQTAELGKVDVGGGGTIAYICALYGMNVIDSGVAVLNMHAPMEIIDKADLYEAMKAYRAFMQMA